MRLWIALVLVGCGSKAEGPAGGDGPEETTETTTSSSVTEPEVVALQQLSLETGSDGLVSVEVTVDEGDRIHLSMESNRYVGVEWITDPEGTEVLHWSEWWEGDESLTGAVYGWEDIAALNWPVRTEDGPLSAGTWTVELFTIDDDSQYADGTIDVEVRVLPAPSAQEVHVDLWLAEGVGTESEVAAALPAALASWEAVFADAGLTLVVHEKGEMAGLDSNFQFVDVGSELVADQLVGKEPDHLVMLIGEVYRDTGYQGYYGVAGGIPGPLVPTRFTWVTVSWLAHAGGDGVFDAEEADTMGWTMAHEIGHYMGLFHPVECGRDCGGEYDAISDTERCNGTDACEESLGTNLMFPTAVCGFYECLVQTDLSAGQAGVLINSSATR